MADTAINIQQDRYSSASILHNTGYSALAKAGLVLGTTTGAFLLAKAIWVWSWVGSKLNTTVATTAANPNVVVSAASASASAVANAKLVTTTTSSTVATIANIVAINNPVIDYGGSTQAPTVQFQELDLQPNSELSAEIRAHYQADNTASPALMNNPIVMPSPAPTTTNNLPTYPPETAPFYQDPNLIAFVVEVLLGACCCCGVYKCCKCCNQVQDANIADRHHSDAELDQQLASLERQKQEQELVVAAHLQHEDAADTRRLDARQQAWQDRRQDAAPAAVLHGYASQQFVQQAAAEQPGEAQREFFDHSPNNFANAGNQVLESINQAVDLARQEAAFLDNGLYGPAQVLI